MVALIDPLEGQRYVEQVNSEAKGGYLDNIYIYIYIYNITSLMDDYVNPTADEKLSWWSIGSCTSYSGEALEK